MTPTQTAEKLARECAETLDRRGLTTGTTTRLQIMGAIFESIPLAQLLELAQMHRPYDAQILTRTQAELNRIEELTNALKEKGLIE